MIFNHISYVIMWRFAMRFLAFILIVWWTVLFCAAVDWVHFKNNFQYREKFTFIERARMYLKDFWCWVRTGEFSNKVF